MTNVNTVMRIHARGVRLAEFLSGRVGVDLNSVRQLDFHTTDVEAEARFVSKGRWELLDSERYYYPNLVANSHTDWDEERFVVDDEEAALEGAVRVPTLIAVKQYSTKNPNDDLTGEMTADTSFRLCAGQPAPEDGHWMKTSFESAKWVDEIYVVFAGSPPEEPTDPDEPPTEPDESPTGSDDSQQSTDPPTEPSPEPSTETPSGSDDRPQSTDPTTKNNEPGTTKNADPAGSTRKPSENTATTSSTKKQQAAVVTKRPSTVRSTIRTSTRTTARTTVSTTRGTDLMKTTAVRGENMGQLVVNGYDDVIPWKENSDDVQALQKPVVTTAGARNAALLFGASFAAGALIMLEWFKKER